MIFLDTGFLVALVVEEDSHHERVRAAFDRYRGRDVAGMIVTTNHILSETVTLLRRRSKLADHERHAAAVRVGKEILAQRFGRLHQVTAREEAEALAYLEHRADKAYSFVDCTSFVVMERLGIREALSIDADFTHRFTAIPGPLPKHQ